MVTPHLQAGLALAIFAVTLAATARPAMAQDDADPAEVVVGERLFLETRFAQFFFANSQGDANASLSAGDPVLDNQATTGTSLPGPFAGQSMNCRACHLVDEFGSNPQGGNRTYADFARRSPVPAREDGHLTTPRNSPSLVNATLSRSGGLFLHFDGEFASTAELVKGTFTGRNFGWLPGEQKQAIAHIAHIIRDDNGKGALAQDTAGLRYRILLKGTDPSIPEELVLPGPLRVNVYTATDGEILDGVARLVAAYVKSLAFARDDNGEFNGSPYDVFLKKNNLPRRPGKRESNLDYALRLRSLLDVLPNPQFVTDADGTFQFHDQPFVFGTNELAGLKTFLAAPSTLPPIADEVSAGRIGNCVACHAPPNFTDSRFHNTGAAQSEYDSIHGEGAFDALAVPTLAERSVNHDVYLPPTAKHPDALGPFLSVPSAGQAGFTDLGLWNAFANPDHKKVQARMRRSLIATLGRSPRDEMLEKTIGLFKTPGLRDLADSAPYFHNGQLDTLNSVVGFYRGIGVAARVGTVRNADPQLAGVVLNPDDLDALAAFLRSLTEDYN